MGAWARGWVSRRTPHPTSHVYSLFLWQMEVKRGNLRLLSPQIKPESKRSLHWGSSARGVPAEPPGRGSLASLALSEEAHGAEISLLAAWRVSGRGDITVKAENFDINVFGGQKDNLKASATCDFSLPVSPLLRYEDEIRLCSGMEYTFTELKKVSGKRRFSSGRALHRLREVTEEAGAAGCSGGAQPRAGSGLRPRAAAVLGGNSSAGATATTARQTDKCVWAACGSEKPTAPAGSAWGPGQPTPAPSRGWSAPARRAPRPSTLLGGRQRLSSRRNPRAGKGWKSITVFALVSCGRPHPG